MGFTFCCAEFRDRDFGKAAMGEITDMDQIIERFSKGEVGGEDFALVVNKGERGERKGRLG